VPRIVDLLADPERLVRYVAMTALAHLPPADWLGAATARPSLQMRLRALVAADLRREPPAGPELRRIVAACIDAASPGDAREDRLDLLRVLGRFRQPLAADRAMAERIETFVGSAFPDADRDLRFEQARLLGEYRAHGAFGKLLTALESEADRVMQFHLAQALARIPGGWSPAEEERAVAWFLGTQHGWFAEPAGKGLEFPEFWTTVLAELAAHHGEALLRQLPQLDLGSPLGKVVIDLLGDRPDGAGALIGIYLQTLRDEVRRRVARALAARRERRVAIFLRDALASARDRELRSALLLALAQQEPEAESDALLLEGLLHDDPGCVASILTSLATRRLELTERLAGILVSLCGRRQEPFRPAESLLARLSGTARPAADGGERQRERPTEAEVEAARSFGARGFASASRRSSTPRPSRRSRSAAMTRSAPSSSARALAAGTRQRDGASTRRPVARRATAASAPRPIASSGPTSPA
jgi:hypothetical protein